MTIQELRERQQWTLVQKIDHSLGVIDQFQSRLDGKVYVSFSGGKDSVVMLSLVEVVIPQVKCVFVMTGCESPSVCRFIREQQQNHNIEIVRPVKTLQQVFAEYGFPLVSKEVARDIHFCRHNPYTQSARRKLWLGNPYHIPERWLYLLNEPYEVSDRCCYWLKKQPTLSYMKRTGRFPFVGILADEGYTRQTSYLRRGGCNTFKTSKDAHPTSWPIAIWTEQDIWQYINGRHLQLPDIYFNGAKRTGCMGCAFGVYKDKEPFKAIKTLWPRWYNLVMGYENNGVSYGEAIQRMIDKANHRIYNENHKDIQVVKEEE